MTTVSEIFETMAYGPAPESDKPALEWIARQSGEFGLFIGGRGNKEKSDGGFDVITPATTARLARVTQAGQADVDSAVAAARKAFPAWAALSGHARARHLYALARAVQKHSRLLAVLESLDNGKSIRETRDLDIPLVARHLTHHAGWARKVRSWCSTTPIWTGWWRGWWTRFGSTRGRCVARARACWCTRGSPSGWSRSSGRAWKSCGWARRSIRRSTWVRSSRRCSS